MMHRPTADSRHHRARLIGPPRVAERGGSRERRIVLLVGPLALLAVVVGLARPGSSWATSMITWFSDLGPAWQSLLAGTFTWLTTALGAGTVVLVRKVSKRLLGAMLGLAAGVMLAASFWSLLAPGIELAEAQGIPGWLPATTGFLLGGALIRLADVMVPHLHPERNLREGPSASWRRTTLLVSAITLHNVPEGLAIGVAFGAAAVGDIGGASFGGAVALAVGIGIQNFPEGVAVAVPLRAGGYSRFRSFFYGQASAVVEPISALVGALAVVTVRPILPYALAFAAGAMVFVVVEELIPESQVDVRHHDIATLSAMVGFAVMMTLDVALG